MYAIHECFVTIQSPLYPILNEASSQDVVDVTDEEDDTVVRPLIHGVDPVHAVLPEALQVIGGKVRVPAAVEQEVEIVHLQEVAVRVAGVAVLVLSTASGVCPSTKRREFYDGRHRLREGSELELEGKHFFTFITFIYVSCMLCVMCLLIQRSASAFQPVQ